MELEGDVAAFESGCLVILFLPFWWISSLAKLSASHMCDVWSQIRKWEDPIYLTLITNVSKE